MTTPGTPQLDYAEPPPLHRRRWVHRWIIRAAVLTAALVAFRTAPQLWVYVQARYWQHKCLAYTAPAGQVMFEDQAKSPGVTWGDGHTSNPPSVHSSHGPVQSRTVTPWDKFYALDEHRGTYGTDGLLFLHSRSDGSGKEHLVVVRFAMRTWYEGYFETWTYRSDSSVATRGKTALITFPAEMETLQLRLFAGQPDPNDPSHFTIDYELGGTLLQYDLGGKRGTIDGWLQPGGKVFLKRRS